jgi:hypothetical protein
MRLDSTMGGGQENCPVSTPISQSESTCPLAFNHPSKLWLVISCECIYRVLTSWVSSLPLCCPRCFSQTQLPLIVLSHRAPAHPCTCLRAPNVIMAALNSASVSHPLASDLEDGALGGCPGVWALPLLSCDARTSLHLSCLSRRL